MIATALRYEIESHAARVRATNPQLRAAAAGEASPVFVERYLSSLRYMFASTPRCLARAAARARSLGDDALADYLSSKATEEIGHDRWAEADLAVLRSSFTVDGDDGPVPAIVELLRFLEQTIEEHPAHYLAYLVWAEYITVLLGGELIGHLVERSGIPRDALTCVAKHVELDEGHAAEGFDAIDDLVSDPRMLAPMRRVLHRTMALFDRACAEWAEAPLARAAS